VVLCFWREGRCLTATNVCPKHVELILKINKYCSLLHIVGLGFITLPTLKMHGQTQIKYA
jgi:hypothetical protein